MPKTINVFLIGLRVMLRDPIMLILIPAPFLVGALFFFGTPLIDSIASKEWGISLVPWYPLIDALICSLSSILITIACAFLLLEEHDEGLASYYRIAPSGRLGYLIARIGIPTAWSFVCGIAALLIFGLSDLSLFSVVSSALMGSLFGLSIALLIVVIADNRVEGLAVSKLSGIVLIGLIVAYCVDDAWRWFFAILPSFWLGELVAGGPIVLSLSGGLVICALWIAVLLKRFLVKV